LLYIGVQQSAENDGDLSTTPYVPGLPSTSSRRNVALSDTQPTSGKPNDEMSPSSATDVSRSHQHYKAKMNGVSCCQSIVANGYKNRDRKGFRPVKTYQEVLLGNPEENYIFQLNDQLCVGHYQTEK